LTILFDCFNAGSKGQGSVLTVALGMTQTVSRETGNLCNAI